MLVQRIPLILLMVLALACQCRRAEANAGVDPGPYIEYLPGTLPLVISAPHGGYLKPADIPDRADGKVEQDSFTQEMARGISEEFQKRTGGTPHLILCRLHRVKLDCNREIKEAAQGNPIAEKAWHEYHAFIKKAEAEVQKNFGAGLYIDLHGQRHEQGRIELGYLLTSKELELGDEEITKLASKTSIRELDQRSPVSFVELLRGKSSLGGMLEAKGYLCVPSPAVHAPKEGELYFAGGYDTQNHTSVQGGTLSGLQIECSFVGVRDTKPNRETFARNFCEILTTQYFPTHFGKPLALLKAP